MESEERALLRRIVETWRAGAACADEEQIEQLTDRLEAAVNEAAALLGMVKEG